ncbi:uncharacterized protein LOC121371948 [Gigantopelta aegis]|uniref:uncharacterized protein LOC121371948 n=1 Tax=Gigantopelta aegis TaxID=1735272 RepID=UPI001B88DD17|nr:uncharacterized protein LOC121371948 [Gigantopelta aegis]
MISMMEAYPSNLRYAQDSISRKFRDGRTLEESLESLLDETNPASALPPMDVMYHGGHYYVSDGNRRLFLLKLLQSERLVGKVKVYLTSFNEFKFTTVNEGVSVTVRGPRNIKNRLRAIIQNRRRPASVYSDFNLRLESPTFRAVSSPSVHTTRGTTRQSSVYYSESTTSDEDLFRPYFESAETSARYTPSMYREPKRPPTPEKSSSWGCTIL